MRTCQNAGAAAVILHVGGLPVPFPLLEHLPRDYGDLMIPTLVVPRDDVLRLQAHVETFCTPRVATPAAPPATAFVTMANTHLSKTEPDLTTNSALFKESGAEGTRGGGGSGGGSGGGVSVGVLGGSKSEGGSGGSLKGLLMAATSAATSAASGATTSFSAATAPHMAPRRASALAERARLGEDEEDSKAEGGGHRQEEETHDTIMAPADAAGAPAVAAANTPAVHLAANAEDKTAAAAAARQIQLICTVCAPVDCRREMVSRAVPLLRRMHAAARGRELFAGRLSQRSAL